jgi:hypothetical protein
VCVCVCVAVSSGFMSESPRVWSIPWLPHFVRDEFGVSRLVQCGKIKKVSLAFFCVCARPCPCVCVCVCSSTFRLSSGDWSQCWCPARVS